MRVPHKLSKLKGYGLNAHDGEIGKLEQVYFDDKQWIVRYFIVRTGGWLMGSRVLILPALISGIDVEAKTFDVDLTQEQVRNCPSINTRLPVSRHYEQDYYRYYGKEPYWSADSMAGLAPTMPVPPVAGKDEPPGEPQDPHLRSSDELKNYHIHALDGDIGHVEDLILEEPGWEVRYMEVDTRNWLPGKHVLIDPAWIKQVDWAKQEVVVKLKRDAIETAPAYDPAKVISLDYQVALYEHYGMKHREDE